MLGIPVHTHSPISATNSSVAPKALNDDQSLSARPGAAPPTPTRTTNTNSQYTPPPAQPGPVPLPQSATITAKPSVPPPPRAGEKAKPPEYYAPVHATPTHAATQAQPYPQQMSIPPPGHSYPSQPPVSITSLNQLSPLPQPSNLNLSAETQQPQPTRTFHGADGVEARRSLEHPPGYVQNSHALDMTPDQRLAMQQEHQSGRLGLGENKTSGYGQEESVWDIAKRFAKGVGDKVTEINEKYGGKS